MNVTITLFANYREIAREKDVELSIDGETVRDVINALIAKYPPLSSHLFQEGNLKKYVNVLVNGKSIRDSGGLDTPVSNGDQLRLFPPVSGG